MILLLYAALSPIISPILSYVTSGTNVGTGVDIGTGIEVAFAAGVGVSVGDGVAVGVRVVSVVCRGFESTHPEKSANIKTAKNKMPFLLIVFPFISHYPYFSLLFPSKLPFSPSLRI